MDKVIINISIKVHILSRKEYMYIDHKNIDEFLYDTFTTAICLTSTKAIPNNLYVNDIEVANVKQRLIDKYLLSKIDHIALLYGDNIIDGDNDTRYRYMRCANVIIDDMFYADWKMRIRDSIIDEILK
jgi:hypothetical protein